MKKLFPLLSIFVVKTNEVVCLKIEPEPSNILSINETSWKELASTLSVNASLYGPILSSSYEKSCNTQQIGTNAYAISDAGNGICMHAHDCQYEFCLRDHEYNLPSFTVDVQIPEDISAALHFATEHDIPISVKTTGHSYQGSSTKAGSLMIWMHNYPKDGTITSNFEDSCGDVFDNVVGIGGGETWDDVLEHVKGDYHIVTGGGRTVSAAGGWLMGGGLSFSSRHYGIGVDQVVEFDIVLANGTQTKADACTNADLFWALRGGGGGTFGVVTHVQYKLHPVKEIIQLDFILYGFETLSENDQDQILFVADVLKFLDLWTEKSLTLDTRWGGFFISVVGFHLVFAGSLEDAKATFITEFYDWFDNNITIPKSKEFNYVSEWGAHVATTSHANWYEYKGGAAAAANPDMTDATGPSYEGITSMAARLVPTSMLSERRDDMIEFLLRDEIVSFLGIINYFLGGNINTVNENATAVHPALRNSVWSVFTFSHQANEEVRKFMPNNITGVCYNHHNTIEPDWRNASWGDNYERLNDLKEKYDPDHRFNCWHCVGYIGEEVEYVDSSSTSAHTPFRLIFLFLLSSSMYMII